MKVLLVTEQAVSGAELRAALPDAGADAEVKVVAPALHESALRFWLSDADEAIARAAEVKDETVSALRDEKIEAHGDTGEADPLQAIADALVDFPADRIVVYSGDQGRYREAPGQEEIRERFGLPVEVRQSG